MAALEQGFLTYVNGFGSFSSRRTERDNIYICRFSLRGTLKQSISEFSVMLRIANMAVKLL